MLEQQEWFEYAVFDDDGVAGIRDEAPESIKIDYINYLKQQQKLENEGIKV